jgi:lysophospholipase L1-like esterase
MAGRFDGTIGRLQHDLFLGEDGGRFVRTVVCYGDSNTWGSDPETGDRFAPGVRWPGVLARELGDGFRVVEEGLGGRTTVWDDPIEGAHKNGRSYLRACLESHRPIDLLTVMLGTNDLKARFGLPASDIAQGAASLAGMALRSGCGPGGRAPAVLLISPPATAVLTEMAEMFDGAGAKSRGFPAHYRRFAEQEGCAFLDAGEVIASSGIDGIHLEAAEHRKLGEAVAVRVREVLR